MRVWYVNPGYLNRQSLLGEHRDIHVVVSILAHAKQGMLGTQERGAGPRPPRP